MNLKKTTLVAISVLFITNITFSQSAPGYLGKKTTIGFGIGLIPAIDGGPDAKNRGNVSMDRDLRSKTARDNLFNFELTRTVARNGSVSLLFSKTATGVNSFFRGELVGSTGTPTGQIVRFESFLRADISSIGIMYNFFNGQKGYLAPLGGSFSIGLKRNRIKASVAQINGQDQSFSLDLVDVDPIFSNISLVLGWSRTIILKDIIYIKPRLLFAANTKVSQLRREDVVDEQSDFESDFHVRVFQHEVIQIDISAGIVF